jgi:methionyl aminopeptidase
VAGGRQQADGVCADGGEPRGSHLSRDGDGCVGEEGGDDEADGDVAEECPTSLTIISATDAKKKRKKAKSKKKKSASSAAKQTEPPRIPLSDLFPDHKYPEGEVQFYGKERTATAEARYHNLQRLHDDDFLRNYRKAAEVHRQARQHMQKTVKPGQTLLSVAEGIEDSVRALLGHAGLETGDSLKAGMGFPTGLCLNNQTAHYTPNPGQKDVVLKYEDVLTVDYGVHINGWIVDSAYTVAFDPTYDNLLAAVKEATNAGVKATGIDVRICDVSAEIQETMESHEVEIKGKTIPIKAVRNISAHNINQWHIHGGKSIPFVKNSDQTKMEEGEVFAIETFGTTGRGWLRDDVNGSMALELYCYG